jgi:integrin beta 8
LAACSSEGIVLALLLLGLPTFGLPTLGLPTLGLPTFGLPTFGLPTLLITLSLLVTALGAVMIPLSARSSRGMPSRGVCSKDRSADGATKFTVDR